jgi:hypothetical protein
MRPIWTMLDRGGVRDNGATDPVFGIGVVAGLEQATASWSGQLTAAGRASCG